VGSQFRKFARNAATSSRSSSTTPSGGRVTVEVSKRLQQKINKRVRSIAANKGLMKGIAKFALLETKKYVRIGISPKTDKRFPPLAESTIRTRDSFDKKKNVKKSPYFIPDFSNLTMTGQLVRAMQMKYDSKNFQLIMVFKQSRKDSELKNDKLIEHLDSMGRYIVGVPKHVKSKIIKALNIFISRRSG